MFDEIVTITAALILWFMFAVFAALLVGKAIASCNENE